MAAKLVIILCATVAQIFAAPKPCYTNCGTSGSTFSHETISGMSTHGNFMSQQNAAFQQLHQTLMNQLQEAHHLDYSQPGTWSKNAAYKTNDGGQVYQEHGKVETDNAQMRYFKKNYTNSWSSGTGDGNSGATNNDLLGSQGRLTGGGYSGGSSHHEEHHQNWEINSNGQQSQNTEDFGVQQVQTTPVSQTVIRNFEDMARNLESYITQCTERVQMGQLSNYQSYTDVVQQHLDHMKQAIRDNGLWSRLIGQINSLETKLNELKAQAQHSANLIHTGSSSSHASNTLVTSGAHQPVIAQGPVGGASVHEDEEYKRRVSMTSSSHPAPIQSIPGHNQQYVSGSSSGYQQSYQYGSHGQTGYVNTNRDVSNPVNQHSDYTHQAGYGQGYSQQADRYNQAGGYNHGNAGYTQGNAGYHHGSAGYTHGNTGYNQLNGAYNQHGNGYNEHTEQAYPVHSSPVKTVEENWNSSGSRKETTYGTVHALEPLRRASCRGADGQYTWCASNHGQTENMNFATQGSGCHGAAYGTLCKRYKREYKDDYSQQTEDLTQQTEDLTQQTEDLTQQTEDLTQQTEDLTQQTEDLTQSVGTLQVGRQRGDQRAYGGNNKGVTDFTQQSQLGGTDFGHQNGQERNRHGHRGYGNIHGHEQHGHNDGDQGDYVQQTQVPESFPHQHQHHRRVHGHNDGDQGDYTEQTQGSDNLSHQHQHHRRVHGHNDGEQGDYAEQTQGFDNFSQQHQYHRRVHGHNDGDQEDYASQYQNQGRVHGHEQHGHNDGDQADYSQQHRYHGRVHGHERHGHNDGDYRYDQQTGEFHYSQQQQGNLQLNQQQDQQRNRNQGRGSYGGYQQQNSDFTQQTQGFDDLTTGSLQLGQQQIGHSQFGNQRRNPDRYGGFGQQTEDLSQQTQSFGDWTQQSSDDFRLEQQQIGSQHRDLSQQTQSFGDLTQQTEDLQFGHQQHDLAQQTQSFDLSQQSGQFDNINERPAPKPPARGQIRPSDRDTVAQDTPLSPVNGVRRRPTDQTSYSQNTDAPGVVSIEDQFQQTSDNQWHNSHHPSDLTNENYQQGSLDGSQNSYQPQNSTDTQLQLQPRILEAYGGKGPYSVNHNDNIFTGVKPNPTATLAPIYDSWDIREKPNEVANKNNNYPTFAGASDRAPRYEWEDSATTTTPAPGFWKRVGNKIATTYEKTKETISSSLG